MIPDALVYADPSALILGAILIALTIGLGLAVLGGRHA